MAVLFGAAGWACLAADVCGSYHDDAVYVATARSLAEGRGYRQLNLPHQPAQTKYPILYPALLACVWRLWPDFPANVAALKSMSLVAGAAGIGLSYLYLRRWGYASRSLGIAAAVLAAGSPFTIYLSTQTLSEPVFAVLLVVAAWCLEHHLRVRTTGRLREFALGVMLALPFLCRVAGIVFMPTALLLLWRTRLRLFWAASGMSMAAGAWLLWCSLPRTTPLPDAYYTDYFGWWVAVIQGDLLRVMGGNLIDLLTAPALIAFRGFSLGITHPSAWQAWALFCTIAGIAGAAAIFRSARGGRALPWLMLPYAGLLIVWPWPPGRFVVPVLPLLMVFVLVGLRGLLGKIMSHRCRACVSAGVLVGALVANASLIWRHSEASRITGYPFVSLPDAPVHWSDYEAAFAWLRANSRPDDVIASGLDTMVHLYTARPAIRPYRSRPLALFYGGEGPPLGTLDDFGQTLAACHARYLLKCPMPGFAEEEYFDTLIAEYRERYPARMRAVYGAGRGPFVVYELLDEPEVGASIAASDSRIVLRAPNELRFRIHR